IAKSNGRTVSTLPISLRVSNPGQDAADAQEVAQKQAAIEQKRQQIAANKKEQEAQTAAIQAEVMDRYNQLSSDQRAFIRECHIQHIAGMASGLTGSGSFLGPSLAEYLVSHQNLLE
ncbi:MAG: hypothetical protein NT018_14560, partial [Armatimonadetes bacterium]|nr:hypothetical protein [Armatimonadota bacterium]